MMIDLSTIKSLELIQNIGDSHSKDCLFGLMNSTFTPMGSRLLRANLLQPMTEKPHITRRWDAVDDLLAHQEVFVAVRKGRSVFLCQHCLTYEPPSVEGQLGSRQSPNRVRYDPIHTNNVFL